MVRGPGPARARRANGVAWPAGGALDHAEIHQRRDVPGILRQDLAVEPLGLGMAPGLVIRRRQ